MRIESHVLKEVIVIYNVFCCDEKKIDKKEFTPMPAQTSHTKPFLASFQML